MSEGGAGSRGPAAGGAGGLNAGGAAAATMSGGATVAGQSGDSGVGGSAGQGTGATGATSGAAGTPGFGGAGAAGAGGSSGAAQGGMPAAGSGGAPEAGHGGKGGAACTASQAVDLGAPAADGFALKVQLASDLLDTAPTTVGIVQWSLDAACLTEAHIDFGLDTTYGMTAPVDLGKPGLRTVLVGMKPEKTYHFRIVATDASQTRQSDDRTLQTGAATTLVPKHTVTVSQPDKVDKGFFVGSYWQALSDAWYVAYIADTDGDIVWWYTDPSGMTSNDGIGRARLSADSQDIWMVRGQQFQPVRRVSLDTLDVQVYDGDAATTADDTRANHDICAVSGGTMAYVGSGSVARCPAITELDRDGTTRVIFDASSVTGDACHGNAIRYSKKQDLYVLSDRVTDVFVVDRAGNLKWKLSDKVSGGHDGWGGMQHGVELLDSSLLIFANHGVDLTHSQAIEFGLDGSVIKKFSSRYGSDYFGDVQRLPSGNTQINYGNGRIQQVDADDNVVVEFVGASTGYSEFRKSLYGEPIDIQH
ncbi:MAG TPA: hypothetical protein VGQ57_20920 [Polyangiaceae bacterium]|nr:hypothetical protein [Polyangiaceae bacterium]